MKDVMLKTVDFQIDGKSVKKGRVKVFNTKQFFIRFKLENDNESREYDLPYPFKVTKTTTGYLFDYCLSAFCPRTEDLYWKMLMMNKSEASKLHNNYLRVISLSA